MDDRGHRTPLPFATSADHFAQFAFQRPQTRNHQPYFRCFGKPLSRNAILSGIGKRVLQLNGEVSVWSSYNY